jgi:hypothetical protein
MWAEDRQCLRNAPRMIWLVLGDTRGFLLAINIYQSIYKSYQNGSWEVYHYSFILASFPPTLNLVCVIRACLGCHSRNRFVVVELERIPVD